MKIERIVVDKAPKALGAYSHATCFNDSLIYTAGLSARDPKTNQIPGVELDATGKKISYDIALETKGCIENLKLVLEGSGSSLRDVLEVTVYLINMKDFDNYNKVFQEYFSECPPARTTVAVAELPAKGMLAIEMKAVAVRRQ